MMDHRENQNQSSENVSKKLKVPFFNSRKRLLVSDKTNFDNGHSSFESLFQTEGPKYEVVEVSSMSSWESWEYSGSEEQEYKSPSSEGSFEKEDITEIPTSNDVFESDTNLQEETESPSWEYDCKTVNKDLELCRCNHCFMLQSTNAVRDRKICKGMNEFDGLAFSYGVQRSDGDSDSSAFEPLRGPSMKLDEDNNNPNLTCPHLVAAYNEQFYWQKQDEWEHFIGHERRRKQVTCQEVIFDLIFDGFLWLYRMLRKLWNRWNRRKRKIAPAILEAQAQAQTNTEIELNNNDLKIESSVNQIFDET